MAHTSWVVQLARGLRVYYAQPVFLAGLTFALLYYTVLSFGSLMSTFLYYRGVLEYQLALIRVLSAFTGILGTMTYPSLRSFAGIGNTGLIGLTSQVLLAITGSVGMIALAGFYPGKAINTNAPGEA